MTALARPETLTAATARHIGDAIVRGEFAPETALPESTLARSLQVSRGTVREALRLLAEDGLVEIYPHRGAWVAPLTVRAVRETYSLRMLRAAMGRIEDALQAIERAAADGSPSGFVDADLAFHETISRSCDHGALLEVLTTIRAKVRRYMFWGRVIDTSDVWVEYDPHVDIVAAIRSDDPDTIEKAVREHIIRAGELLIGLLERPGEAQHLGA
jgi:DNA-binding GntR family transcriptional regulator